MEEVIDIKAILRHLPANIALLHQRLPELARVVGSRDSAGETDDGRGIIPLSWLNGCLSRHFWRILERGEFGEFLISKGLKDLGAARCYVGFNQCASVQGK